MTVTDTDRLTELEARIDRLTEKVDRLAEAATDSQAREWEARLQNLQLQAALGRMDARDELEPLIARLRKAYDTAKTQLSELSDPLGEGAAAYREAREKAEKAFEEAWRVLTDGPPWER